MKRELVKKSIEKEELQLTLGEKEAHYGLVIYILIIPAVFLFFTIKNLISGNTDKIKPEMIIFSIVAMVVSFISYKVQKRRLKLTKVETTLDRNSLRKIIDLTAGELKWTPTYVDDRVIVAKTFPGFWSGSWGEQITIMFDTGKIFVNSICDPDKRSSVFSNGRNSRNMDLLVNRVKAASR